MPSAVYDEALARELLGFPAGYRCDHVISLGYPSVPTRTQGGRVPLSKLVHRDRWA